MTLQGVPTYGPIWEFAKKFVPDAWEPALETIGTGIQSVGKFLGYGDKEIPHPDQDKYPGRTITQPGRSIVNDALSVWGALRAKKDQEGLNAAEMEQFNKLNQQLAAAETEFDVSTDFGQQLKPEYETDITKSAAYTPITFDAAGATTPDLTIDAKAYGGRIGFNQGTNFETWLKNNNHPAVHDLSWDQYSALSKLFRSEHAPGEAQGGRIGYNMGGIDTPFQGIGALNPRMGYQRGSPHGVDIPTFSEGVQQMYESGPAGVKDFETINWERESPYGEIENLLKGTRVQEETDAGAALFDKAWDLVKRGLARDINHALQMLRGEINQPMGAAYGGRIGAQKGGIMPLLNLGGMEKDYRQDGGFVPIGRREKADDVPARLSKNEFVFTADAVRAAGGGDIDQGAQRMYNVMKNLEAGGDISEQSQGKA